MPGILWQLEFNGDRRTLQDWGIEANARLRRRNMSADEFTADLAPSDTALTDSPVFSYGSEIALYRGDVCWFRGKVPRNPVYSKKPKERQSLIAAGPWLDLERIVYQQTRKELIDEEDEESGTQNVTTSSVVLFQNLDGSTMDLGEQITAILQFAIDNGVDLQIGTIDPDFDVPWEEGTDLSCANALRRCMRWCPDAVEWIDYTTTPPTIHVRRRANLTSATRALTAIEDIDELTSLPDLVPAGVQIFVRKIITFASGRRMLRYPVQNAGTVSPLLGVIVSTIKPSSTEQPIPTTLAAQYYSTLSTLQWAGRIRLHEEEVTGVATVGNVFNITSGQSAWSTMNAVVQEVAYAIQVGTTEITIGPMTALGLSDFIALLNANRNTRAPTGEADDRPTGEPVIGTTSAHVLDLCDGSTVCVARAFCPPA
jgi:hypothetical protein